MDGPISSGVWIGGEASGIVRTLRDFGPNNWVPIGLVARSVGREPVEIEDSLNALKSKDIILLNVKDQLVTLVR